MLSHCYQSVREHLCKSYLLKLYVEIFVNDIPCAVHSEAKTAIYANYSILEDIAHLARLSPALSISD